MERWLRRTVELGAGLVFTGKKNPSVIPYSPAKSRILKEERQYFRRVAPERAGVSSGRLFALLGALEAEPRCNVHSLLCLRGERVICECSHPGYSTLRPQLAHSMAKTVVGMAVGLIVSEGRLSLDRPICELFPEVAYRDKRFPNITVENLLLMTSGVRFCEPGSVSETEWLQAYFSSAVGFLPGTAFSYNSMNSYVLSQIVSRITGESLVGYLTPRLFEPLGIDNLLWEVGPEGVQKGGWGLYMSPESWAKLGRLILSGGVFEGKRILPESWIRESISTRVTTPANYGAFDYGYHLWLSGNGEILFSGMLGQYVWLCPKNDITVVLTSGNNEIFGSGPTAELFSKYLSGDLSGGGYAGTLSDLRRAEASFFESRHRIRPYTPPRGIGYLLGFRARRAYPPKWELLLGSYDFADNNIGVLPLFVRTMQNNLSGALENMTFRREGERMVFDFTESGRVYSLYIGFSDFFENELDYNGEKYAVKVMGEVMEDEDRRLLYKLELLFPELPNIRYIKLVREGDALSVRMSEIPDERAFDGLLSGIDNPALSFAVDLLKKRLGENYMTDKLRFAFSPTLVGARVGSADYEKILLSEKERSLLDERERRIIGGVIDRFFRDTDGESDKAARSEGGLFRGVVDGIGSIIKRLK